MKLKILQKFKVNPSPFCNQASACHFDVNKEKQYITAVIKECTLVDSGNTLNYY